MNTETGRRKERLEVQKYSSLGGLGNTDGDGHYTHACSFYTHKIINNDKWNGCKGMAEMVG